MIKTPFSDRNIRGHKLCKAIHYISKCGNRLAKEIIQKDMSINEPHVSNSQFSPSLSLVAQPRLERHNLWYSSEKGNYSKIYKTVNEPHVLNSEFSPSSSLVGQPRLERHNLWYSSGKGNYPKRYKSINEPHILNSEFFPSLSLVAQPMLERYILWLKPSDRSCGIMVNDSLWIIKLVQIEKIILKTYQRLHRHFHQIDFVVLQRLSM